MIVVPETVGKAKTGQEYIMRDFDTTVDLDSDHVYDLNGITGVATDTWKTINGVLCRKFLHVRGAEAIMANEGHAVMWFYLPDMSDQDHLAMGLFIGVTDENL